MIIRRLIVPLSVALVTAHAGQGFAQGAFPAPLPGQAGPSNASSFPPADGVAPISGSVFERGPASPSSADYSDECMRQLRPLREEAQQRGKLIRAASNRHASPEEACKLIANFGQAEIKMIKYFETNASKCGIPPQIAGHLKDMHKNTESMQTKVCTVAQQQQQQRGPSGPTGDFWTLPEEQL